MKCFENQGINKKRNATLKNLCKYNFFDELANNMIGQLPISLVIINQGINNHLILACTSMKRNVDGGFKYSGHII